ncbi:MAG: LysM peptidoglycan-binding domain-containing protein [Firmicutes bacterium]|nr:LysM peptidoglycan-binding domain-containing protein [Bacillota bacterium]
MDFYFLAEGSTFRLPVNPEEVTVEGEKQIETVNVINLGEIDFPTGDRRTGIRFASFFPAHYDSGYCRYADIPDPKEAINQLIDLRTEGKPVRFLVTETTINTLALVTSVNYTIKGGEPGDIYYEVSLRTWRDVKVRTAAQPAEKRESRPRPDTKPVPKVYITKEGDSLYKIAKLQLNDGNRWRDIYSANRKVIGPDPNRLQPGTKLVMPK